MFSPRVLSHWTPDAASAHSDEGVVVAIDPDLSKNRSVSLLRLADGPAVLSVTPARALELGVAHGDRVDTAELATRITGSGITLNDPDHLFYLSLDAQAALRHEPATADSRPLTAADADLFEEFTRAAPDDDLDEAFVELDHWIVFGTFVDDRLVAAASMYPWSGTQLADLGVITLPEFRGRGLGRVTVRAISAEALERGYEPQYRCQLDNAASVALARAAGFSLLGTWEVIDADD